MQISKRPKSPWFPAAVGRAGWYRFLPLVMVAFCLAGCGDVKQREAAQVLAVSGASTSQTMASYYDSLASMVEGSALLEDTSYNIQTEKVQETLTQITSGEKETLRKQAKSLRNRESLAQNLAQLYAALAALSNYDAPSKINASVNGLLDSVTAIKAEDTTLGTNVATAKSFLSPLTTLIVTYKQNRDICKAIKNAEPALASIRSLVVDEKPTYDRIMKRHFELLQGIPAGGVAGDPGTKGLNENILEKQGISSSYALRDIPSLKDVPYGGNVTDPTLLEMAKTHRKEDLEAAKANSLKATDSLVNGLTALINAHNEALRKEPLTLETVDDQLAPLKDYLALYKALQGIAGGK